MKTWIVILLAGFILPLAAPAADASPVGVWKLIRFRNLDTGKDEPTRLEFHTFTARHHVIVVTGENRPKIHKNFWQMTPEEVKSQMPVGAGFEEYRVEGNKVIRTVVTAMSAYYTGRTIQSEFEFRDGKLVLRDNHHADGCLREWIMERLE